MSVSLLPQYGMGLRDSFCLSGALYRVIPETFVLEQLMLYSAL